MDPVSHASLGRALAGVFGRRDAERALRGTVTAAILGALSPDLDSIFMPFGWDRYLRVHEIGLHTIVGTLACAALTAAVVRLFVRGAYPPLFACAWMGAASHVLLDLLSSARLRPAWPFIDAVVSLPVVAMADPWLLTLCLASAMSFWIFRSRRPAAIALAAIVVFVLAKGVVGVIAFRAYEAARDREGEPVVARAVEAEWATLNGWRVLDRTPRRLRAWQTAAADPARLVLSWPIERESALVSASRQLSTVRNFLRAHELGFAVEVPGDDGRTLVLWSDIRFCWAHRRGAAVLEPIVRSREGGAMMCALWFGGGYDAQQRSLHEIVKVGGFTQSR